MFNVNIKSNFNNFLVLKLNKHLLPSWMHGEAMVWVTLTSSSLLVSSYMVSAAKSNESYNYTKYNLKIHYVINLIIIQSYYYREVFHHLQHRYCLISPTLRKWKHWIIGVWFCRKHHFLCENDFNHKYHVQN